MSRVGYGLHRLTGGFAKREREAWEKLPAQTCPLKGCGRPAAALIATWQGLKPVCAAHAPQAEKLGYVVLLPGDEE